MDGLGQKAPATDEVPRFDDGMINIQELIRIVAESLVNEIMDAQAEDACAVGNQRNGYRARTLTTSVGTINLRIPRLRRGGYFPDDPLVRYSRVDRAVIVAVPEMVTSGVSIRKVAKVAAAPGIDRTSTNQVSRICGSLDEVVEDMQCRNLSDAPFPCIWLDATYAKCRDDGRVSSCALVTTIGAGSDGYRRLLGLNAIDTESYAGWLSFLGTHDGSAVGASSAWRRTRTRACEEIAGFCPKAALLLEEAEADALAYLDFPYEHHGRLRPATFRNVQTAS